MSNFNYNVTGEKRKELVRAMSEILGEDASYQGAPSFAFKIDGYIVSRDGLVTCPDTAAREEIAYMLGSIYAYAQAADGSGGSLEICGYPAVRLNVRWQSWSRAVICAGNGAAGRMEAIHPICIL